MKDESKERMLKNIRYLCENAALPFETVTYAMKNICNLTNLWQAFYEVILFTHQNHEKKPPPSSREATVAAAC